MPLDPPYAPAFPLIEAGCVRHVAGGRLLAVGAVEPGPAVALFDADTLELVATCPVPTERVNDLCEVNGLLLVAHGGHDGFYFEGNVAVWDLADGACWPLFERAPQGLRLRVDPASEQLVVLFSPWSDIDSRVTAVVPLSMLRAARNTALAIETSKVSQVDTAWGDIAEDLERGAAEVAALAQAAHAEPRLRCFWGGGPQRPFTPEPEPEPDVTSDAELVGVLQASHETPVVVLFSRDKCWACGPTAVQLGAAAREDDGRWRLVVVDGPRTPIATARIGLTGYPIAIVVWRGLVHAQILMPSVLDVRACLDELG